MVRCQELGSAVYRTRVALHYERNDVAKVLGELPPLTHADATDGDQHARGAAWAVIAAQRQQRPAPQATEVRAAAARIRRLFGTYTYSWRSPTTNSVVARDRERGGVKSGGDWRALSGRPRESLMGISHLEAGAL